LKQGNDKGSVKNLKNIHRFFYKALLLIVVLNFCVWQICFAAQNPVKEPNVSGIFYPAKAEMLSKMIENFFDNVNITADLNPVFGLLSPHAGYIYSGQVTAFGYKAIYGENYKTVIIIGPSHYLRLNKIALYRKGSFKTPLGKVDVDTEFAAALLALDQDIQEFPSAFEKEHSIEVQIPFLQKSLKNFKIVPILIRNDSYKLCEGLANALSKIIGARNDVLVIVSSDLSHYHTQDQALSLDTKALAMVKNLNPSALFEAGRAGQIELCGLGAVVTLLLYMQNIDAHKSNILKYASSFDVTHLNKNRVVGYGSAIFYKTEKENVQERSKQMFSKSQKQKLLSVAKQAIVSFVKDHKHLAIDAKDPLLLEKCGAFVTIKKDGRLRGCIGHIICDQPLINTVAEMAVQAATGDPRFIPLTEKDLDTITLEISALSPLKTISDIAEIEVGKHGLIIRKGFYSGLLLPQVATEYNWTKEEFLQNTCLKAGLNPDAWKQGAKIQIFSAEVFGDQD